MSDYRERIRRLRKIEFWEATRYEAEYIREDRAEAEAEERANSPIVQRKES